MIMSNRPKDSERKRRAKETQKKKKRKGRKMRRWWGRSFCSSIKEIGRGWMKWLSRK
jgi:hypothetical protein